MAVAILAMAGLAAACSATPDSEVATDALDLSPGGSGSATSTGPDGTGPAPTDANGVPISTVPGATGAGGAPGAGGGTGSPGVVTTDPGGGGTNPPPASVDTSPLVIGAYYTGIEGADSVGVTGLALGDTPAQIQDIANWINANGGMGGRQISVVIAKSTLGSAQPLEAQDQAACATFLEDNHVDLAVATVNTTQIIIQCLADAGVIQANDTSKPPVAATFARYPSLIYSSMPTQERSSIALADELVRAGYFADAGTTLGIVRLDDPQFDRGADIFVQRMAGYGVAPVVDVTVCDITVCGAGPSASQTQSAILQLRSANVNHLVLISDGTLTTPFLLAAASQGYYPRLGIYSLNAPEVMALNQTSRTLQGAVGPGWLPPFDTERAQEGTRTARAQLCHQIVDSAGHSSPTRLGDTSVEFLCDGFFFLKDALDATGGSADPATVQAAVEAFGDRFVPALTLATTFGPGRHDGASVYRSLRYDAGCSCFAYDGPDRPFPAG